MRARVPDAGGGATDEAIVQAKVRIPRAPSMPIERLDRLLDPVWRYRLGLVVAPAGSGKTTLLARLAARAPGPIGWYRAEGWDRDAESLVQHLEAALAAQLGAASRWRTVADVANALDAWRGAPILIVVDDLHTLEATPAEAALERLVEYAPATTTIVAASRVPPGFNLPRLRVSGALMEIGSDDLRFRSWEVERLFRNFYGDALPPEELARLARRTDGWAAGLQLFHLATRGRSPEERRRVLAALGPRSRLMRDYLTRNVLDQLPAELRRFLVETSVLGKLSGAMCDALLDRSDSAELLAEAERRTLLTQPFGDEGAYRCHEVLRSCLQGVLLEELGETRTRDRFRRAGRLLADAGALPEALEAFCRAEDWERAHALLGRNGGDVAGVSRPWVDALPATIVLHDPWLLLASARRFRAEGRLTEAVERYARAEAAFNGSDPAEVCRRERAAVAIWLDRERGAPPTEPASMLRSALVREPLTVARQATALGAPADRLVGGLAMLFAGHAAAARAALLELAEDETADEFSQAAAGLGAAVASMLAGLPHGAVAVEGAVMSAEGLGLDWLARLGRASLALGGVRDAVAEAEVIAATCDAANDRWGAALARLFAAWGAVSRGREPTGLDGLIVEARALGAPVLEAWAQGLAALSAARSGAGDALVLAIQAEAVARSTGVHGALMLAYIGRSLVDAAEGDEYGDLATVIARDADVALEAVVALLSGRGEPDHDEAGRALTSPDAQARRAGNGGADGHVPADVVPLRLRLLGGFEIALAGRAVDLSGVRPRVRSLLRLLSLHAGQPVHHESVEAALWPDADAGGGTRNLHVAVAALRRALEPSAARTGFQLVRREGDAYMLALPEGSEVDLRRFEHALLLARAARDRGDLRAAREGFASALAAYGGDLLPEEGPAEWVTERRELCRLAAVDAAQSLAELHLREGDPQAAAAACAEGLRIERYHDPLWRLLIQARDLAGDQGAARRARQGYGQMLAELGVEAPATASA